MLQKSFTKVIEHLKLMNIPVECNNSNSLMHLWYEKIANPPDTHDPLTFTTTIDILIELIYTRPTSLQVDSWPTFSVKLRPN